MARSLPPLTWFRAFEAAARHLNFTAAAQEIGLTQSAVSQHVKALEDRLGVRLFVRRPRGLALTDDGRKLLPSVGASLDTLRAATAVYDTGTTEDLLTIACSVSIAHWVIAPRLAEFGALHPNLRLRLAGTIWPDHFAKNIADVEIRFGSVTQVGQGAQRLLPDTLIAVRSPDLAPENENTLIETVGQSLSWASWSEKVGRPAPPQPKLFVDSYGMALELAVQGGGTALTSSIIAAQSLRDGRVMRALAEETESADGYFLSASDTEAAKSFESWLLRCLEQ